MASPNGDGYFFRRSVNFVDTSVKRGDIYYADLSPVVGSEQGGVRPVLIVQNDLSLVGSEMCIRDRTGTVPL